ncbi:MAG: DUF4347 domain-containing protein [Oscillatoria sp. SIO1A7]|nr:DUF4347 domain-containing protein [Oscillatoria sp. SIO1A7]
MGKPQGNQIAFIDPNLEAWQILATGVRKGIEVIILDPVRDAIEQITAALAKRPGAEAVHIICHGSPGALHLGETTINARDLDRYLQSVGREGREGRIFTSSPSHPSHPSHTSHTSPFSRAFPRGIQNLILYGCQVAAGEVGRAFVEKLHQLTGANVAASSSLVGNGQLGGNWELDTTCGKPAAETALSASAMAAYPAVLASFAPGTPFGAGTQPRSVAVGDFNGDGSPDLATANSGSNNVSVLLGDGSGSFGTGTNFGAGSSPISVALGDFNGDGSSDLAVANLLSANVSVLLGDGSGNFGTQTVFGTGTGPRSVAVGDFNNDGSLDLATPNSGSNNVSVLLGDGNGNFGTQANFGVGNAPNSLAVGDFNGDGNSDLAVANNSSDNVSLLLGDGSGNFGTQTVFGTGTGPYSLTVGDFNGDGSSDLATANSGSDNVSLLLGNGNGSFGTQTTFGVGSQPFSVTVGDFNGDGSPDLATANSGTVSNVSLLLGDGNGSFGTQTNFVAGNGLQSVAAGDFNGDGKPDLAVANVSDNGVSILLNTTPIVSIAPGSNAAEAGSTNGTFAITLDEAAPAGGLTVNFNVTGSTATDPSDYSLTGGTNITGLTATTFTIPAGATSATLNVVPIDDSDIETGETVNINLTTGNNYIVSTTDNTAALTITDNDTSIVATLFLPSQQLETTAIPVVSIAPGSNAAEAGATNGTFAITLDEAAPPGGLTVNFNVAGSTATDPSDYSLTAGTNITGLTATTFTIPAGATIATLNVVPIDDSEIETGETVNINLAPGDDHIVSSTNNTAGLTITDNDFSEIEVAESTSGTSGTSIPDGGSFDFGSTLQGSNLNPVRTFTITNSGNTELTLGTATLSGAGYSLVGSFPTNIAAGGSATFQIQLDASTPGVFNGSLSFINGDNDENPYDFSLTGQVTVPEIEVLDGATNIADGTATALSLGSTVFGTPISKTFTIRNPGTAELNPSNPSLPPGFSLVGALPASIAPGSSANLQIQLDASAEGIVNGTVSFENNDADENPFDFAVSGEVTRAEITSVQPLGSTDLIEGAGVDIYQLALPKQPRADVVYTLSTDGAVAVDRATITFTPDNWNQPQTIEVFAPDNNEAAGDITSIISHAATSNDLEFNGLTIQVPVNIIDNDRVGQVLSFAAGSKSAGADADDIIVGSEGDDNLHGRQGINRIEGRGGNDVLHGGGNSDFIAGGSGADRLYGGLGFDNLNGDEGDDLIFAGEGSDRLRGGPGNDWLFGGKGSDHLFGEAGADIFGLSIGSGAASIEATDVIADFTDGEDQIMLVGATFAELVIFPGTGDFSLYTIIQHAPTGEFLARVAAVAPASIDVNDFV